MLVRGPNRMLGYLGHAAQTTEVIRDGLYVSGAIASMDEDGFPIHFVEDLPRLGTGKLDLRGLKALGESLTPAEGR